MKKIFLILMLMQFFIFNAVNQETGADFLEAVAKRKYNLAKNLIEEDVDLDAKNEDGNTALLILSNRNKEMDNQDEVLALAAQLISSDKIDINSQNKNQQTALIRAVISGFTKFVKLLLNSNANTEILDIYKHTALMYAVMGINYIEIIKLLLNANAGPLNNELIEIAESNNNQIAIKLIKEKMNKNKICCSITCPIL